MKKVLLPFFVFSMILIGCTDKKKEEEHKLTIEQEKEIEKLDTETLEIENVQQDIEESTKELDEILEDLEN